MGDRSLGDFHPQWGIARRGMCMHPLSIWMDAPRCAGARLLLAPQPLQLLFAVYAMLLREALSFS